MLVEKDLYEPSARNIVSLGGSDIDEDLILTTTK